MPTLFELRQSFMAHLQHIYPPSEAQQLFFIALEEVGQVSLTAYLLDNQTEVAHELFDRISAICTRLATGEPIQYILGKVRFCGVELQVSPQVLIPRPETQELVEWIVENTPQRANILDIATGSGCIAIALAKSLPKASLWGWDISNAALQVAQQNALQCEVSVCWEQKNALSLLPVAQRFDVIVSNPPYIRPEEKAQMHTNVLDFEPHLALFAPADNPLIFYQHIADFAFVHLIPEGKLFFEINQYLAEETRTLLHQKGFSNTILREDFRGNKRMIMATRTA